MAPSVFISHASRDRKVADAICSALESRGFDCWIAFRDVGPGQNFGEEISRAIRAVKVMVLVFSSHANNSDEIKKEVVLAGRARVPVIPLRVEDVEPTGAFEYELVTRQWIDLFADWDRAVDGLARQVRMALEAAVSPVPPLQPPFAAQTEPPAPPPAPEPTPPTAEPAPATPPPPASASAPPAAPSSPPESPLGAPSPTSQRTMLPLLAGGGVAALAVVGLVAWGMSGKPEPKVPETVTAAVQPPVPVATAAPTTPPATTPPATTPPATPPPATAPAPAPQAAPQVQSSPAPPAAAPAASPTEAFQRGVAAFGRKDYAAALGAARQAADAGHPEAALLVAWIYFKGYGTAQNYAEAMRWYRIATDRGVIEAPNEIGWLHYKGFGVDQDYAEAMRWFRNGDAMGDTSAMLNIGAMYRDGTGVKEDQAEAVRWYRKVADTGTQPMGQALVGVHYQIGQGVEQDYGQAMRWYQAALALGEPGTAAGTGRTKGAKAETTPAAPPGINPATAWFRAENDEDEGKNQARVLIGTLYENGLGVRRDYDEALRWYRMAAERNFAYAYYSIGLLHENGRGVPEDPRQAREWMQKAADRGFEDAKKWLASH